MLRLAPWSGTDTRMHSPQGTWVEYSKNCGAFMRERMVELQQL